MKAILYCWKKKKKKNIHKSIKHIKKKKKKDIHKSIKHIKKTKLNFNSYIYIYKFYLYKRNYSLLK